MTDQMFTIKDCIEFNKRKFESTLSIIQGNCANKECKELTLLDDSNLCNVIHSLIHDFYSRELERATEIDEARCAMRELNKIEDINKQLSKIYCDMQEEIGRLENENTHLKSESKNKSELQTYVSKLLDNFGAQEWIIIMNKTIDILIMAMDYINSDAVKDPLYFTRRIQDFFIELAEIESQKRNE